MVIFILFRENGAFITMAAIPRRDSIRQLNYGLLSVCFRVSFGHPTVIFRSSFGQVVVNVVGYCDLKIGESALNLQS
jgi:hypothetical protein